MSVSTRSPVVKATFGEFTDSFPGYVEVVANDVDGEIEQIEVIWGIGLDTSREYNTPSPLPDTMRFWHEYNVQTNTKGTITINVTDTLGATVTIAREILVQVLDPLIVAGITIPPSEVTDSTADFRVSVLSADGYIRMIEWQLNPDSSDPSVTASGRDEYDAVSGAVDRPVLPESIHGGSGG